MAKNDPTKRQSGQPQVLRKPPIAEELNILRELPPRTVATASHCRAWNGWQFLTSCATVSHPDDSPRSGVCRARPSSYGWLKKIVGFVKTNIRFPEVNIPLYSTADFQRMGNEDIEEIAIKARRFWGLGDGPISNVTLLAENNGVIASRFELGAATLDAFSVWSDLDGIPFMILGADKEPAVRSPYDVAHELGPVLLHKYVDRKKNHTSATFRQL